jgi:hypothetical protein
LRNSGSQIETPAAGWACSAGVLHANAKSAARVEMTRRGKWRDGRRWLFMDLRRLSILDRKERSEGDLEGAYHYPSE